MKKFFLLTLFLLNSSIGLFSAPPAVYFTSTYESEENSNNRTAHEVNLADRPIVSGSPLFFQRDTLPTKDSAKVVQQEVSKKPSRWYQDSQSINPRSGKWQTSASENQSGTTISPTSGNWGNTSGNNQAANQMSTPVELSIPAGDISKPVQMSTPVELSKPTGDISKPVQMSIPVELSKPAGDISKPVQMSTPVELSKPSGDISKPVQMSTPVELSKPNGDISKPVELTKPKEENNSLKGATVEVKNIFKYSKILNEFYPGATYTNTELLHEHFYFSDGTNIGWEKAGLFTYDSKPADFTVRASGYDELKLKQAIIKTIEDLGLLNRRYSLLGDQALDKYLGVNMNDNKVFRNKYNCQDFVQDVLILYPLMVGYSQDIKQNEAAINAKFAELLQKISHEGPL